MAVPNCLRRLHKIFVSLRRTNIKVLYSYESPNEALEWLWHIQGVLNRPFMAPYTISHGLCRFNKRYVAQCFFN